MFNRDFNELLSIFNDYKVKYLVVGGYAVGFHAQPRATDTGLKAFLISRDDLIAANLAAGRPQDLADVAALRKAAESKVHIPAEKKPRNRNRAALARAPPPKPW